MVRVISPRTIKRKLRILAEKTIKGYQSVLSKVPNISLHVSLDLWTARNHSFVMGIRVHFIDENWQLQTFTVGFLQFSKKKTGENIREIFKDFFNSFGLNPLQFGVIMTDNAAENLSAFNIKEFIGPLEEDNMEDTSTDEEDENVEWVNIAEPEDEVLVNEMLSMEAEQTDEQFNEQAENIFEEVCDWSTTKLKRHGCVAHALQLVINECLKKNPETQLILKKIDSLLSFFNTSTYWHAKLKKVNRLALVKPGDTRWNGILLFLERIKTENYVRGLNQVLELAASNPSSRKRKTPIPGLITSTIETTMIELSELLLPFLELTNLLQADGVTSSLVIPGIIGLYKEVASVTCTIPYMFALRGSLCIAIMERFGAAKQLKQNTRGRPKHLLQIFDSTDYIMASLLHPEIKLTPFQIELGESKKYYLGKYIPNEQKAKEIITKVVLETTGDVEVAVSEVGASKEEMPTKKRKTNLIWKHLKQAVETKEAQAPSNPIDELTNYLNEDVTEGTDPLEYSKSSKVQQLYPNLTKLARKYLAFPSTSGGIERIFSIAGSIARARRACLAIKTIYDILFHRESSLKERTN